MRTILSAILLSAFSAHAEVIEIADGAALVKALKSVGDGDVFKIAPGKYPGGHYVSNVARLTIEAADASDRPVFEGGNQAWHFSRTPGLVLKNLVVRGQSGNGINLDDGGKMDEPVPGIRITGVRVEDIGPKGNFDGIKCSGLRDLEIRDCEIEGWGGQAIDFVGCRDALISGCTFTGKEGFSQHTGPQFKGGCENITIEKCHFVNAGERPIQAGGSTGMDFFRPPGAKYEARGIIIQDNLIECGLCPTAFTGVTDVEFRRNKIMRPEKWIFRILQETQEEGFKPCGDVRITDNEIVFRRAQVTTEINIGERTAPESFTFARNRWLAEDQPARSKPRLPTEEKDGRYE